MNKKTRKMLLGTASAALIAVAGFAGTFAYLQDTSDDVVNTFNPNSVKVDLIEHDKNGDEVKERSDYNIIPGTSEEKDPTVTVENTVDSYVFVEITDETDGLVSYTVDRTWTQLPGYDNVYYREVAADAEPKTFSVLSDNKISYPASLTNEDMYVTNDDGTSTLRTDIKLSFTAKAIQKEPFDDPEKAYNLADAQTVDTSEALQDALEEGKSVILSDDIEISDALEIGGDTIIDGAGKTITVQSGDSARLINLNENTEDVTLTIVNAVLAGPESGTYTRGISIYQNTGDVNINMDESEVSANYYAINIASGNKEVNLDVKDSVITGWAALNIWSKTNATFTNCTLTGLNDKTYNADGWNGFATIVINEGAEGSNLTFNNCTIIAKQTTGNKQYILSLRDEATVAFNGCKFVQDDVTAQSEDEIKISANSEEIVSGSDISISNLVTE